MKKIQLVINFLFLQCENAKHLRPLILFSSRAPMTVKNVEASL